MYVNPTGEWPNTESDTIWTCMYVCVFGRLQAYLSVKEARVTHLNCSCIHCCCCLCFFFFAFAVIYSTLSTKDFIFGYYQYWGNPKQQQLISVYKYTLVYCLQCTGNSFLYRLRHFLMVHNFKKLVKEFMRRKLNKFLLVIFASKTNEKVQSKIYTKKKYII